MQGCGAGSAYFFFIAFILIVSLVFLNLFIAIILEGFAASASEQSIRVGEDALNAFQKHWLKYDPLATGLMSVENLESFIMDLVEDEIDKIAENNKLTDVNFNLTRQRAIMLYTKWKRNKISDQDREDFFKDFDKNRRR